MMEDSINDYVFIDGVHLLKDKLLVMAKKVGIPNVAEHYLYFLTHHAFMYKMNDLMEEVSEIRDQYQFAPLPNPKPAPGSDKYNSNYTPLFESRDEKARKAYKKMSLDEKIEVLRISLQLLRLKNKLLFPKQNCWIGIYMVVRDRLDSILKPKDFYEIFAKNCMPSDWPEKLKIKESTLSTLSRYIKAEDREFVYYEMEENPFKDLCNEFWKNLSDIILTKD